MNPTIEVEESADALALKLDLIVDWELPWMFDLLACENYEDADIAYFNSQEKYRLLGDYDYLERPYAGEMSYETSDNWPYRFEDLRNYTLCLDETYDADLWTSPSATYKQKQIGLDTNSSNPFSIGLANKAGETDYFTLSAAWGEKRTPAGDAVTFERDVVQLAGETPTMVDAQLDTTGLLGEMVLWIKAVSQKAGEDPESQTDYVEIPVMINVTPPGCSIAAALAAGQGSRPSPSMVALLFSALLIPAGIGLRRVSK